MLTQMSTCGWMRDIWSEENDGFIEDLGPDLEAEIGEGARTASPGRCLQHASPQRTRGSCRREQTRPTVREKINIF